MVAPELKALGLLLLSCPAVEHTVGNISKDADNDTKGQDTRSSLPSPVVQRSIIRAENF